jgi:hypothetical protein
LFAVRTGSLKYALGDTPNACRNMCVNALGVA